MRDYDNIVRDRQRDIRDLLTNRKISVKAAHMKAGWENPSTFLSYFPANALKEPAVMSVASLYRLLDSNALPADLLSLLLPDDFQIVRKPVGMDHDDFARCCRDYTAAKDAAHHPESEAGREIGPGEDAALRCKAAHLKAVA